MSDLRYAMFCESACGHDEERYKTLIRDLQDQQKVIMIGSPDTTAEDYARKKFAVYIEKNGLLPAFLDVESANRKSLEVNAIMDGKPMTVSLPMSGLNTLLEQYVKKNLVCGIRFYEKLPFHIQIPLDQWLGKETEPAPPTVKEPAQEPPKPQDSLPREGVSRLIKMLDETEKSKISQYPTYAYFEKLPQLLQKLIQVNHCDPAQMDTDLDLPSGVTLSVIQDPQANISTDVLRKYLTYFGLEAYMYRYVSNCDELRRELKSNPNICQFEIKPSKPSTKERFMLKEMKRAKDQFGCWLYQLTFKSEQGRDYQCIVTSPLDMIVGKNYELTGLEPAAASDEQTVASTAPVVHQDEGDQVVEEMKAKFEKEQRSYLDLRKDQVIAYFKIRNPEGRTLQLKEAEAHYNKLAKEDDLLDEFFWKNCCPPKVKEQLESDPEYLRRRENQPKDVTAYKDYTADKLRREFPIKHAWEVYFALVDLRNTPRKTMEYLRYKKTDPQYQK